MKLLKIKCCGDCSKKDYTDYTKSKWFCGPLSMEFVNEQELSDIKDLNDILNNCPLEDYQGKNHG